MKGFTAFLLCFLSIFSWFVISSCSTENNTFINRTYHRTTAKYNGYYNANELIKTSLTSYRASAKEDFYEILPIEQNPKGKEIEVLLPSIDTAISKCTKVIQNHCMPSMDKPEGKKVEYNTYIDENWITIGKAYYYKHDNDISQKNFEYVQRLFKEDKSNITAAIWVIKNLIVVGKYTEAKEKIKELETKIEKQNKEEEEHKKDKLYKIKLLIDKFKKKSSKDAAKPPVFTKRHKADVALVKADLSIQLNDFPAAIENLEKSIKLIRNKKEKIRISFILGQLYSRTKQPDKAKKYFTNVVASSKTPFEMQFNARINRAFLGKDEKVKKELTKLLKDEKNSEYRDQLYYALAELAIQEKDIPTAFKLLHKSTYFSTSNKRQLATSYERLGVLSYQNKNYVNAQKYFDSCANVIPENYPNADEVRTKANKLKNLVTAVTNVETQDSLLRVAAMNEKDRTTYISKSIKQIKENQARKLRDEAKKLKDIQAKQAIALDSDPNSNKSYWNNIKTKADGYSEFKKNWGSRENTDDWRRNEKTIVQPSMAIDTTQKNNATANNPEIKDTLTVENLSKNLPLTEEQKLASLNKIVENQYTAGLIYKDLLQEQKLATQCFDDVINRKLNSDFQLLSAYQLYKMNEGKDSKKAQFYRVYILQNFPNSDYANYLKDVNFFVKKKEEEKKLQKTYLELVDKYRAKEYQEVIDKAELGYAETNSEKLKPKFLLLKCLAKANLTEDKKSLLGELQLLQKNYSESSEGKRAAEMIQIIEKGYSEFTEIEVAQSLFSFKEGEQLWIIVLLDEKTNSNDAKNKIAAFNDEYFPEKKLNISSKLFSDKQSVVIIKPFSQTDTDEYINTYKADMKNLKEFASLELLRISPDNLRILFETHKLDEYKQFHSENY
jgi:hypothetical protein